MAGLSSKVDGNLQQLVFQRGVKIHQEDAHEMSFGGWFGLDNTTRWAPTSY